MAKVKTTSYQTQELTIEIDHGNCISCGTCTAIAPKTFELDKSAKTQIKKEPIDDLKTVLDAAESCPVEAIRIIERQTGKTLWPKT